ncbi:MAG: phosphatidylglycerol lysyltransferase domain-containing protein [Pyrinomonadaceae bacterium]
MAHMFERLREGGWSPVTVQDEYVYTSYFALSHAPFSYEQNWAFIAQETRFGAMKYEDNGLLLTAVIKAEDSGFIFILPPCGDTSDFGLRIAGVAAELAARSTRRVVLRKLPLELYQQVLSTNRFRTIPASAFIHPRDVPEDQFPQVVIDISATLAMQGAKFRRLRNNISYFARQCKPEVLNLRPSICKEVINCIAAWSRNYNQKHAGRSLDAEEPTVDLTAYTVLAEQFAPLIDNSKYFAKVLRVDGCLVAVTLAGISGNDCAAQYVNLSALRVRGCAEFIVLELLRELSRAGLLYLNMGGAETEGQFLFKKKFDVHLLKESFEVEYIQ